MEPIVLSDQEKHIDGIACNVNRCVYHNDSHQCTAKAVHIGPVNAQKVTDTICGTFRNKDR
ncbi:MAG: DUF1540 domain-containing protein [Clostridia bacterium]|nr:DUF1540 domain-containing protein [Clostridia bacterium]